MSLRKIIEANTLTLSVSAKRDLAKRYTAWSKKPGVSQQVSEAAAAKAELLLS